MSNFGYLGKKNGTYLKRLISMISPEIEVQKLKVKVGAVRLFKPINHLTTPLGVARCKCICSLLSDGFVFAIFARKIPFK